MYKTRVIFGLLLALVSVSVGTANGETFRISNNTNSNVSIAWAVKRTIWQESGGLSSGSSHYEVHGWKRIVSGGETQIDINASQIYLLVLDANTGKFRTYSNEEYGKKGSKYYTGFMVHRTMEFNGIEYHSSPRTAEEVKKINAANPPCPSLAKGKIRAGNSQSYSNWDSKFWPGDPNLKYVWGFWRCKLPNGKTEGTFYLN